MRKFKRLASLALAAVMTLGMCAPAFATGGDLGENPPAQKETKYNVFQIFTGTYANMDGDTLGDIKWGQNGKVVTGDTTGGSVSATVLEELAGLKTAESDKAKLDVITKYVDFETTPIQSEKTLEELKTLDTANSWANGYYLVRPVGSDNSVSTNEYVPYVVTVVDQKLNLNPKKGVPTVDKNVVKKNNEEEKKGAASIGDTLDFKIEGTLPDNLADYKSYYYTFTDTMSKGLKVIGDEPDKDGKIDKITGSVKIVKKTEEDGKTEDIDVTDQFYFKGEKKSDGTTEIIIGVNDLKKVNLGANKSLSASDKVVVTYSATLTKEASVGTNPNTNEVKLTYSNDPRKNGDGKPNNKDEKPDPDDPTGETVSGEKGKTETYVTGLTVTDFADGKPMTTAAFTLTGDGINSKLTVTTSFEKVEEGKTGIYYKLKDDKGYTTEAPTEETKAQYEGYEENGSIESIKPEYEVKLSTTVSDAEGVEGNAKSVKAAIDGNGSLTITGLSTGQYTLHQESAPAGYNVHHDITFTVGFNNGTFDKTAASGNMNDGEVTAYKNWFYVHINQGRGSLLPETGGVGTTMMYIGGMLLIAMAGATIILKGKKAEDSAE